MLRFVHGEKPMAGPEPFTEARESQDKPEQPLARAALRRRKRRDAAMALPLLGVFLLASPFVELFSLGPRPFGVPLAVAYIFVVWFALIVLSFRLSRRLADDETTG